MVVGNEQVGPQLKKKKILFNCWRITTASAARYFERDRQKTDSKRILPLSLPSP
jgi:hypothetical protein